MIRTGHIWLALTALLLFVTAFNIPGSLGITGTKLDDSYPLVIEDAASRGAVFGTELIYTHGPLGYLYHPQGLGGFRSQRLLYAVLRAAFSAYVCCTIATATTLPIRIALLIWMVVQPLTPTVLYAGVAVRLLYPPALLWLKRAEWYALPAVCGLCGMVKFTELLSGSVVVSGVAVVFAYRGRWREAAQPVGVFALTVLGVWLAAGQPLGGLPDYLRNSWEVATGFAVMTVTAELAVLASGLAGVSVLLIGAAMAAFRAPRDIGRALALLPTLASAFITWKHGYMRADTHVANFFNPLGAYAALLFVGMNRRDRWNNAVIALALVIGVAGMRVAGFSWAEITPGITRLAEVPSDVFRTKAAASEKDAADQRHILDESVALPRIKAAVGSAPVDIFNYQQAYAYINGLVLRPRPVFQSYLACTPRLQRINLDFYHSQRRPGLVLFSGETVDRRWRWLDDAPLALYLLTDWEPIARERGFVLMEPASGPPRGEWRDLAGGESEWGEEIPIPPHPSGSLVALTIEESGRSFRGRIKRFFYQGANLDLDLYPSGVSRTGHIFIPEMAAHRVLISPCIESVDDMIAWRVGAPPPRQITQFRLTPWDGHDYEFRRTFRYRLSIWTPVDAPHDNALAERGRALLYPYLPTIPDAITPALQFCIRNGVDLGWSTAPCRIEMAVPPDTSGIKGIAVIMCTKPAESPEVIVGAQLKDGRGKTVIDSKVRPTLGSAEIVQIDIDFPLSSVADGQARFVLDAENASTPSSSNKCALIVWGPLRWKTAR